LPRVVMWHYIRDGDATPRLDYRGITPATFGDQLDAIAASYQPIGWRELAHAIATNGELPDDAVLLTFDDGLIDHAATVLPALTRRGLRGCFFVLARRAGDGLALGHRIHVLRGVRSAAHVRDAVLDRLSPDDAEAYRRAMTIMEAAAPGDPDDIWKRPLQRELAAAAGPILSALVEAEIGPEADVAETLYLDEGQARALVQAGMTLGGHTHTHPWLDALHGDARRQEVAASRAFLERQQPGPWPFAYPYGAVPPDPAGLLRPAGFSAAFTTDPSERSDPYRIGRVDGDDPSWAVQLAGSA